MHYKFLDSRDVDRVVVDGTLMISSLRYFRGLEETAGDIGDPLEGCSELTIRDPIVATENSPELEMLNTANIGLGMFEQFAKVESGGQIKIGAGTRFVHSVPNFYIYSFSQGDLAVLKEEMCVKASRPYDACLMIRNPTELAQACFRVGTIMNLENRRVDEVFELVAMNPVEYLSRSIDVTEGKVLAPDAFRKSERFRHQSETRLLFAPRDNKTISEQRLTFLVPNLAQHFDIVFRNLNRQPITF